MLGSPFERTTSMLHVMKVSPRSQIYLLRQAIHNSKFMKVQYYLNLHVSVILASINKYMIQSDGFHNCDKICFEIIIAKLFHWP